METKQTNELPMVNLGILIETWNDMAMKKGWRTYDSVWDILKVKSVAEYTHYLENKLRNELGMEILSLDLDENECPKLPRNMLSLKVNADGYVGVWAHQKLVTRMNMLYDPEYAHFIIRTFKDQQLLQRRDEGGEAFKALMEAVHEHLSPNQWDYAQISKSLSQAVFYDLPVYQLEMKNIWNTHHATPYRQNLRKDICGSLTQMIVVGFIKTVNDLHNTILKLKQNYRQ